ncbi:undecaprenyl phosphate-alpha-L-ara4N flippase subunit ArnE [Clostridium cavendishii DSM 21758]|uniref:Undecaprenyl phosphate-alpha-L-ara4N flippase subunit ArnE n=1 Tax=Clostridium cavendishii DSM 21758 TaxID=1121302 RepID=A0A1M6UNH1_9CLOT|nr:permease [Clostridium cavendishii]SHK70738.1 undecaprenyl phosphate-alpha-L-ara4N flippase subunit ArnE [Clostridium cavendishii DSM 21758]
MENSLVVLTILIMTLCGALGGVYLKKSTALNKKINISLIIGLGFYGTGAILNIILLRFIPLTIVFPCNAITYIWSTIFAKLMFKEKVGIYNVIGLAFISSGLVLLVI